MHTHTHKKNNFCILFSFPLDLKFTPLVTLVHGYVSTKLEASTAFVFQENQTGGADGWTDGHTWCNT